MSPVVALFVILAVVAGTGADLLKLQTHYPFYPAAAQTTYVVAEINTPASEQHVPVDLVVVVDSSGSMDDAKKMPLVKETLLRALPLLREDDRMGIVAFSDDAKVVWPLSTQRAMTAAAIGQLTPLGATNLGAGLSAALDMLKETRAGATRAMMVLTDGHTNRGVQTLEELLAMIKERGVPCIIHTFGYGADHDVSMLKNIADANRGSYFFVEKPHEVGELFGVALGSIQSAWAEDVKLEFMPGGWNAITRVLGKHTSVTQNGASWIVDMGSLLAEQTRRVVFEVTLASQPAGAFDAMLSYTPVHGKRKTVAAHVVSERAVGLELATINEAVEVEVQRARASEIFARADELARRDARKEARDVLSAFLKEIEASPARPRLSDLMADVKRAHAGVHDDEAYMHFGSQFLAGATLTNGQIFVGTSSAASARAHVVSSSMRYDPDEL